MAKLSVPNKILSPKQVVRQWANVPHKFEVELWNFEARVARAAVKIFKQSFEMRRLNTDGSALWPERKRNYSHPILHETGTLQNSIRWRELSGMKGGHSYNGYTFNGIQIYTDPTRFGKAKRHKGFCYAAVHNGPDRFRSGAASGIARRQFIGHSTALDDKIREYSMKLFAMLP